MGIWVGLRMQTSKKVVNTIMFKYDFFSGLP